MSLSLNFNFGRLLRKGEKVTTAKINAIIKGMSAALSGTVDTADITAGAVTTAKIAQGAHWYASASYSAGTYTAAYTPAVSSYTDGLVLAFKAGSANVAGAASLDAGAGAKPLRKEGGKALEIDALNFEITNGSIVEVRYNTTLVAGGCWEITSITAPLYTTGPMGYSFRNLTLFSSSGSENTTLLIQPEQGTTEIITQNSTTLLTRRHVNVTGSVSMAVSGAGGRDTGSELSDTWYYLWFIYNPTTGTESFVFSTNDNVPTLPSGYTFYALIGAVYNDASSNLIKIVQQDRHVYTQEQTVFTSQAGTAALTFSSLAAFVPPNAKRIRGNMGSSTSAAYSMAVAGGAGYTGGSAVAAIASNPVGLVRGQSGNSALVLAGLYNAVSWEVPAGFSGGNIGVWTAMGNTSAIYALTITGYDI